MYNVDSISQNPIMRYMSHAKQVGNFLEKKRISKLVLTPLNAKFETMS